MMTIKDVLTNLKVAEKVFVYAVLNGDINEWFVITKTEARERFERFNPQIEIQAEMSDGILWIG